MQLIILRQKKYTKASNICDEELCSREQMKLFNIITMQWETC